MSPTSPTGALRPSTASSDALLARFEPLAVGIADRFARSAGPLHRDDLRQVARLTAWNALGRHDGARGTVRALVSTAVRNALIDEGRARRSRTGHETPWPVDEASGGDLPVLAPDGDGTVGPLDSHLARADALRADPDGHAAQSIDVGLALARVPDEARTVVVRTVVEGYTLAEVGADLGLSPATTMRRRDHALLLLSESLSDYSAR